MVDANTFTAQSTALLSTMHKISMSILHSQTDAQDAVQQALLKAWASKDKAQPERFRAWLARIVINECHNIQRHRMRVSPVETVSPAQAFAPPDVDVTQAIEDLPEKWRIPFLLKYAGCYTEREIAAALKIPVTTVKSRLYSARQALREKLSDKEVSFE